MAGPLILHTEILYVDYLFILIREFWESSHSEDVLNLNIVLIFLLTWCSKIISASIRKPNRHGPAVAGNPFSMDSPQNIQPRKNKTQSLKPRKPSWLSLVLVLFFKNIIDNDTNSLAYIPHVTFYMYLTSSYLSAWIILHSVFISLITLDDFNLLTKIKTQKRIWKSLNFVSVIYQ